jgi:hypothetical protein
VRRERTEVELQGIGLVHNQLCGRVIGTQARDQITVQLNHMQGGAAIEQRPGERARAGTDLDQGFARLRVEGVEDALHDAAVVQEVLAEALFRLKVGHKIFSHGCAQMHTDEEPSAMGS